MKNTIFATGADIKNRFLFVKGKTLFSGPDIGDLSDAANYETFKKETIKMADKAHARPGTVVCDLHPGYFSTRFAEEAHPWDLKGRKLVQVQHHHAHIASVMHEHGLKGPVIGVSFDGTGYGTDGNIWGGEFLVVDKKVFKRAAHLKYLMMPGGEKAVSEPWRMVLSILGKKGAALIKDVPEREKKIILSMMEKNINSPLTSSAGRLFDAAAALLGICTHAAYEAEGPIKLEAMCRENITGGYKFKITEDNGCEVIDTEGLFTGIAEDMRKAEEREVISAKFHNSMKEIITKTVKKLSKRFGIRDIALSGGVFQNSYLREKTLEALSDEGFRVSINEKVPVNDLNIALGQYYVSCGSRKG